MEEAIGKLWHRWISRLAERGYPAAAVSLDEMAVSAAVLFRALGGDGALTLREAAASDNRARRSWLQRFAGIGEQVELAWYDEETLRLPPRLVIFPTRELNRELYLWLAAFAACRQNEPQLQQLPWLEQNRLLSLKVIERYPGLAASYARLVDAYLPLRPEPSQLTGEEGQDETLIQQVLASPDRECMTGLARRVVQPVHLWLHPHPPLGVAMARSDGGKEGERGEGGSSLDARDRRKHRAERSEEPNEKGGLLAMRIEAMLGVAEHIKLDRACEEEEDITQARQVADALDYLSITNARGRPASRIRFDLDLPSAAADDTPLGGEILLPEWCYKRQRLLQDHCRLQLMVARTAPPVGLPLHLQRTARRLRQQFQLLAPARVWLKREQEGSEIDLDAYERFASQCAAGEVSEDSRLYRAMRSGERDLCSLLLADLSLSTDAALNGQQCIIDVVRDSLYLFSDALDALGDRFALYGFSSRRREHIRYHLLKDFSERYDAQVRGRLAAIRPGFYTRMGAAIRHAAAQLAQQPSRRKLLLIITDGKPNDLDHYEGRYGIEDTRHALQEARRLGLQPFCVTIDKCGADYLPYLFGSNGYVVVRKPTELPQRLPLLYAQLTG